MPVLAMDHMTVLLKEAVDELLTDLQGKYVDCTYGRVLRGTDRVCEVAAAADIPQTQGAEGPRGRLRRR